MSFQYMHRTAATGLSQAFAFEKILLACMCSCLSFVDACGQSMAVCMHQGGCGGLELSSSTQGLLLPWTDACLVGVIGFQPGAAPA